MIQTSLFDDWKPIHHDPVAVKLPADYHIPRYEAEMIADTIGTFYPEGFVPRCLPAQTFGGRMRRMEEGTAYVTWGWCSIVRRYFGDGVVKDVLTVPSGKKVNPESRYVTIVKAYADEDAFRMEGEDGTVYELRYEIDDDLRPWDLREREEERFSPETDTEHLVYAFLRASIPCDTIGSMHLDACSPQVAAPAYIVDGGILEENPAHDTVDELARSIGISIPWPYHVPSRPFPDIAPLYYCKYCIKARRCD